MARRQKASSKTRSQWSRQREETQRQLLKRERLQRKEALAREKEALEQQAATSEILRAISSSPSDLQPVLDTIMRNFMALCGAVFGAVFTFDGKLVHYAGGLHFSPERERAHTAKYPVRVDDPSVVSARTIMARAPVHINDTLKDPNYDPGRAATLGVRRIIGVPLLRDGVPVGAIVASWAEPGATPKRQERLLKTFADQAVIAIENARLFNETKEALERQTATSEILRVISSSPTDVRPVLDAVAVRAATICQAQDARVFTLDGNQLIYAAGYGELAPTAGVLRVPLHGSISGRAVLERTALHVDVAHADDHEFPFARQQYKEKGHRIIFAVPLLREMHALGAIVLRRNDPQPFTPRQQDLLKTFADQAAIAIENVRLFNETNEALEQQTATAEILRVISSSPTDLAPVFDALAKSVSRLCDAPDVVIARAEGEVMRFGASVGPFGQTFGPDLAIPIRRGSVSGRAVLERRTIHVDDLAAEPDDEYPEGKTLQRRYGHRTIVAAPLLLGDTALGVITMLRQEVRPFSTKQLALLCTFADQAVIAIENARLFNETKEALERQTATGEILASMSGSMTDTKPVFEAIVRSLLRLFGTRYAVVALRRGEMFELAGFQGEPGFEHLREHYPVPVDEHTILGEALIARQVKRYAPIAGNSAVPRLTAQIAQRFSFNSALAAPMMWKGEAIGVIMTARTQALPFDDTQVALIQSFANQAVIAIENARLFNELKATNTSLSESLEQQTATAEILRVIAGSPTEIAPVLTAVAERAAKLCEASNVHIRLIEGGRMPVVAQIGGIPVVPEAPAQLISARTAPGHAVLECKTIHIHDIEEPEVRACYSEAPFLRAGGTFRTLLVVPMIREGLAIGTISARRAEVRPFSDQQIKMVQMFADQAVIAIENVRLFNETKEALERQTATAEILKVIASSPSDVQPVFEAVAERAAQLCNAANASVVIAEGTVLRRVATFGHSMPLTGRPARSTWINGRAFLERRTVHVEDVAAVLDEYPEARENQQKLGFRTMVSVPMIREGRAIGTIGVWRREVKPFSKAEIELLETFADQAVIAIENVRLFNETKEALEQQTATADILRTISSSPTDIRPVLDTVASTAARLCGASDAVIRRVNGGLLQLAAKYGAMVADSEDRPIDRGSASGRAVLERQTIHICDVLDDDQLKFTREMARRHGFRTVLSTPLLREGQPIGTISIRRPEARLFSEREVKLLKTFADQAVIAIENVRLFKELQERTEALTKSVDQLTALGEVGQAISSTLDLGTVLKTIVSRAVQLAELDGGWLYEYDDREQVFYLRAAARVEEEILNVSRKSPVRLGEGAVGRAGALREPVVVEDLLDPSYQSRVRELLIKSGSRALLVVPLLREDLLLGALAVSRKSPGPFAPDVIDLLKTFATQSAVAIQNARLFEEIAEKGKQLEVASQHKSQFLASMSHELRTPLNAILGFNEMLLDQVYGELSDDVKAPLENMQASGKHLLRLINNVLDLAKIEAGRMELALTDYSVQDTVESVRSTLRPLAESKGLELLATVPQDLPLAHGDPGRITQCLMNLAGNSLKFTKEGRVEISAQQQNGQLRYRVADTGIGIPPDKIGSLFTEFKQTDATIASEYGGTGLGLSITKKFIEMHGGRIWVESEPGTGSTFTFEVPLRAAEGKAA